MKDKVSYVVNNNVKIFIGPVEIANINRILADAFKGKKIMVTSVIKSKHRFYNSTKYDKVLNLPSNCIAKIIYQLYYAINFFFKHNIFIFLFGISLLPYNMDLPFYKYFKKRTIMWFMGSDVRDYEAVNEEITNMKIAYVQSEARKDSVKKKKEKRRMIHNVEKHVDHIVCGSSIAQLLERNYLGKTMNTHIYIPLDIENIKYNNSPNEKPILIHCPSDRAHKGTEQVLDVVAKLKNEGFNFDFILYEHKRNVEVREALTRADIAIDQVYATSPGMFATEAMAAGCAVLSGNIPQFSGYPMDLPIIHTTPNNLFDNLTILLKNPKLRSELGKQGREYVEKYHNAEKITDCLLQVISRSI